MQSTSHKHLRDGKMCVHSMYAMPCHVHRCVLNQAPSYLVPKFTKNNTYDNYIRSYHSAATIGNPLDLATGAKLYNWNFPIRARTSDYYKDSYPSRRQYLGFITSFSYHYCNVSVIFSLYLPEAGGWAWVRRRRVGLRTRLRSLTEI